MMRVTVSHALILCGHISEESIELKVGAAVRLASRETVMLICKVYRLQVTPQIQSANVRYPSKTLL